MASRMPIQETLNRSLNTALKAGSSTHEFVPNARAHEAFWCDHHPALKPALKVPLKASLTPLLSGPIRIKRPLLTDHPPVLGLIFVLPFQGTDQTGDTEK